MMHTKTVDSKGRIALGPAFANKTVILESKDENEIRITLARVIPEREAWLYENPKAKASVERGLKQAKEGKLVRGPNIKADLKLFGGSDED